MGGDIKWDGRFNIFRRLSAGFVSSHSTTRHEVHLSRFHRSFRRWCFRPVHDQHSVSTPCNVPSPVLTVFCASTNVVECQPTLISWSGGTGECSFASLCISGIDPFFPSALLPGMSDDTCFISVAESHVSLSTHRGEALTIVILDSVADLNAEQHPSWCLAHRLSPRELPCDQL